MVVYSYFPRSRSHRDGPLHLSSNGVILSPSYPESLAYSSLLIQQVQPTIHPFQWDLM